MKSELNEEDTLAKDPFIKRKVPPVMVGRAISVVGGYEKEKSPPPEVPAVVKRLPEPILPTGQTK